MNKIHNIQTGNGCNTGNIQVQKTKPPSEYQTRCTTDELKARADFIARARALLQSQGYEPTPENVFHVSQSRTQHNVLSFNNESFLVMNVQETFQELERLLFTNPKTLPANFLAIFFDEAYGFKAEFQVLVEIADALIRSETAGSLWAIREIIKQDSFFEKHLNEIIEQIGIESLFVNQEVYQQQHKDKNYTIVKVKHV